MDDDSRKRVEYPVGGFVISAFSSTTYAFMGGADLQGAILCHANFAHSLFAHSNLVGADFSSANLVDVNFEVANLSAPCVLITYIFETC